MHAHYGLPIILDFLCKLWFHWSSVVFEATMGNFPTSNKVCCRKVCPFILGIMNQFRRKHTSDQSDCISMPTLYACTTSGCVLSCRSAWNSSKAVFILCRSFSSSTIWLIFPSLFASVFNISVFGFNAPESFCARTIASSKAQHAPWPRFGVDGWEASPASVTPSNTCDELSCEFKRCLMELLVMFSIAVFSIHGVRKDHPSACLRLSSLDNFGSLNGPAVQTKS